MNINKLTQKIEEASRKCFLELRNKYGEANISGYALYSDASAMSVSPALNSVSHLEKKRTEDPSDFIYYKWSPGEWAHEFEGAGFFQEVSKLLSEEAKNMETQDKLEDFKRTVYEACVQSLENLISEGLLVKSDDAYVIVFTISDSEDPEKEIEWIKRLNTESNSKEFSAWIVTL